MSTEFQTEYLGIPYRPSPAEKRLRELALEYDQRTEAYDRTVCTGEIRDGAIMPADHHERKLINDHALMVRAKLAEIAWSFGFDSKDWQNAIAQARKERR